MEYLDVLDEFGNKTGVSKPRDEVHRCGDWHKSVQFWIINRNNEILLQKRGPNVKKHPNMWHISSSGHIKSGLSSKETAILESKEELGIDVIEEQLEYLFTSTRNYSVNNDFIEREFHDVYLAQLDITLDDLTLQEEEVSDAKFVSLDEFKKMVETKDKTMRCPENIYKVIFAIESRIKSKI